MIKVITNFYSLMITVDGHIHLKVKMKDIYGYQSWSDRKDNCSIQYYCRYGNITCEYQDREVWKEILKQLEPIEFN